MAQKKDVSYQLSLFDICDSHAAQAALSMSKTVAVLPEPENYLARGEKILSLLREKSCGKFHESSFLELFSINTWENTTSRAEYIVKRVKQGLIRPIIEGNTKWDLDLEKRFRDLFCGYDAGIHFVEPDSYSLIVYRAVTKSDSWCVLLNRGSQDYLALGGERLSAKKQSRSYRMRHLKGGGVRSSEFGDYFASMVCICQTKRYLKDYFSAVSKEDLEGNVVYKRLQELAVKERDKLVRIGRDKGVIVVEQQVADNPFVLRLMKEEGLLMEVTDRWSRTQIEFSNLVANFMLDEGDCSMIPLNSGGKSAVGTCSNLPEILAILLDDYSEEKQAQEYRRSLSETYAKSFMTKKNIPEKVVKAMEASGFNRIFGYVEFDEDCDIAKVDEIYKEFRALTDFLKLKEHKEVSLRFRKLGNHKASGLYYPGVKCLCVDVRSPSSFAHELFHMLDFENGEVSRAWDFQKIKDLYKEQFNHLVAVRKIKFSGKYDRNYYFQATEIFARCGEMYLTHICGIDNSLVKPETESVAYPWTDELAKAVKAYYDAFLGIETSGESFASWAGNHEKEAS